MEGREVRRTLSAVSLHAPVAEPFTFVPDLPLTAVYA